MIKRLITLIILAMFLLSGCSDVQKPKLSAKAKKTIEKISNIYGEPSPRIVEITETETEAELKPMYVVFLKGNFQKGELTSRKLSFSMHKDCSKVWAVTADNWMDADFDLKE